LAPPDPISKLASQYSKSDSGKVERDNNRCKEAPKVIMHLSSEINLSNYASLISVALPPLKGNLQENYLAQSELNITCSRWHINHKII
jgi:DNA transposition AAA+ family ATPase